jgi:hypothetical protein
VRRRDLLQIAVAVARQSDLVPIAIPIPND